MTKIEIIQRLFREEKISFDEMWVLLQDNENVKYIIMPSPYPVPAPLYPPFPPPTILPYVSPYATIRVNETTNPIEGPTFTATNTGITNKTEQ